MRGQRRLKAIARTPQVVSRLRREWRTPMERGLVGREEFGLGDEHRVDPAPSFWTTLPKVLPKNEVGPDDVLIDLGSGMGRVVVHAATTYSFRRIIGVEISSRLHEIAEQNI